MPPCICLPPSVLIHCHILPFSLPLLPTIRLYRRCQATHWGKKGDTDRHKPACKALRKGAPSGMPFASPSTSSSGAEPASGSGGAGRSYGGANRKHKDSATTPETDAAAAGAGSSAVAAEAAPAPAPAPAPANPVSSISRYGKSSLRRIPETIVGAGGTKSEEFDDLCPICLDNKAFAIVDGSTAGMCYACGQSICGACYDGGRLVLKCRKCPVCRVDLWSETHEESFKQLLNLSVTREPGAHTQAMQQLIGKGYHLGRGVAQNQTEAEKWICLAAESGYGESQVFLANMYLHLGLNATDGMMTGRMHDARAVQVPNADPISPTEASADYFAKSLKWSKRAVMQGKDERCYGSGI